MNKDFTVTTITASEHAEDKAKPEIKIWSDTEEG